MRTGRRTGDRTTGSGMLGRGDTALIGSLGDAVPSIHPTAWVAPGAVVVGAVRIGAGASVWYGTVLRADDDEISVGAECNIQDLCCIHVDRGQPAVLEERVTVGHHVTIHGARVRAGALIGERSLVAAGTVVLSGTAVPPGVLYAGVPGRVVRDLTDADHERFDGTPQRYARRAARHRGAVWGGEPG